jgi:hypothetical protein
MLTLVTRTTKIGPIFAARLTEIGKLLLFMLARKLNRPNLYAADVKEVARGGE